MKELKGTILFLSMLSVFLFLIISFLYVKNRRFIAEISICQENFYKNQVILKNSNELIETLTTNFILTYRANGIMIDSMLQLKTEKNKDILMKELVGEHSKLVFRYSQLHCNVCVDQEVKFLKDLIDEIGDENILILAHYDSFRNLSLFKRTNQVSTKVFNIKDIKLPIEEYNIPYYFVVNKDLHISDVMIPTKYLPERTQSYLEFVKEKYYSPIN